MNTKNILVSFLTIVTALFLAATVSASEITDDAYVEVEGIPVYGIAEPYIGSVTAGENVKIEVQFTALEDDNDVTVEVELDGDKADVNGVTAPFDVEAGNTYTKTLTLKVPYELKDEVSNDLELNIEIDGDDHKTSLDTIKVRVQRPPYNADIKSISVSQSVEAGEEFPVEIVLKNIGYNDLDDLYVTARIPALGIEKSGYFGDLVALEDCENDPHYDSSCNDDDDTDSVSGKLMLEVPYGVKAGVYTLEVEVSNDDTDSVKTTQITIENAFEKTVFKSGNSVWIVNPTDNVVGYRIVAESPASVDESIVFVPAGASKTVAVTPNVEGDYSFKVNVFSMTGELVEAIDFAGTTGANGKTTETNPIVILTVILAIIFVVLLVVLIVLIGKKPEKSGEFGESYY